MLRNSPTTFLIASLCGIFAWAFFTIPISFILYPVIRIVIVKYFKKSLGAAGRRSVGSGGGGGGDVDSGDEDNATDLTELTSLTSSNSRK